MTAPFALTGKSILVTGAHGFLGRHLLDALAKRGVRAVDISAPSRRERDLLNWSDCLEACKGREIVFHLAARVGGIAFNLREPARILFENEVMNAQILEASHRAGASRFIAIGSVCAYPKSPPVPTTEDHLYDGPPEESNLTYGLAKRMLHAAVAAYRAQYGLSAIYLLPANLYGPGDNFDPEDSHVIPGLIRRCEEARRAGAAEVPAWGDGLSTREFLYVKDCAEAICRAAERYDDAAPLNLGGDREITVRDLADLIARSAGFRGAIRWDESRPSGQRRRRYDASRSVAVLGPYATTPLEAGIEETLAWWRARS